DALSRKLAAGLAVVHGRDDANHRTVGSVHSQRVEHEVSLAPVLARDDAAVALIPIDDNLAIESLFDQELVHRDRRIRADVDRDALFGNRLPAGTGQTIERRVNRVALALAAVVADVEPGGAALRDVGAIEIVVDAPHAQHA